MEKNTRIILSAAVMDLCHKGHLHLLKTMAKEGKVIMVLHDDRSVYEIKGKIPIQNIKQRVENLKITGLVWKIYVTKNTDPSDQFKRAIKKYGNKNMVFMRADDNKSFPGKWFIEETGLPIKYVKYTPNISSTKLREYLLK